MQIEQRDLILTWIAGDSFERLFDAFEKPVAKIGFVLIEPVAGLLQIQPARLLRRRAVSTGRPGQQPAAFRCARTSSECNARA